MKPMLMIGVLLFVLGLGLAGFGMLGVGDERPITVSGGASAVPVEQQTESSGSSPTVAILSGLTIATGALLIGLSYGNWSTPRSTHEAGDEVVDPEGHDRMKHV